MLRLTSLFPSSSLGDTLGGEPKQPRKAYQPAPLEIKEQSTLDLRHDSTSTSISEIPLRKVTSGPASLGTEAVEVHNAEQSQQYVQTASVALEAGQYGPESDLSELAHCILSPVITTTPIEEQESMVLTMGCGTVLSQQDWSPSSFPITPFRQQCEVRPLVEGGVQRKPSFYRERGLPRRAQPVSSAAETRRLGTLSKLSFSVREQILQMEHLHREEKDRMLALLKNECEGYRRASEERVAILQRANEELSQEVVASTSQVAQLQAELNSLRGNSTEIAQTGETGSTFTTITTTITTITTTLITITTRIEHWKQKFAKRTGLITISVTELEKFSSDIAASASEITNLQGHYEELSRAFNSARQELQAAVSLQEEKDRTIVSFTYEIAEKAQQIATELRKNELLEHDLSVASIQIEEFEQAHDALSSKLVLARDELQTKISMIDERDRTIVVGRKDNEELGSLRDHLRDELTRKDCDLLSLASEVEELKRLGATKTGELEATQKDLGRLRDKLEEWERSDVVKSKELASAQAKITEFQHDLATSSSRIIELEQHDKTQSMELDSFREQLAAVSRDGDHTVASLNEQIDYWRLADHAKAEEIIAFLKDLDQLRREIAASADRALEDQQLHEAGSAKLIFQVEKCRLSEAAKAEELATTHEQLLQLQHDLSTSSSLVAKLQQRDEMLSAELTSVHERLKVISSNGDDKDRMVASLTGEVKEWMQLDVTKTEELGAARRDLNQLCLDIAIEQRHAAESAKELSEAQEKTQKLTMELNSLHDQYQIASSSIEKKAGVIATHIVEIERLKIRDAAQAEELVATRNDLEQLRGNSITNQQRHAAESAELTTQIEEWKRSDAAKAEELRAAHRALKQLRSDLAASAAQIADDQRRHTTESDKLTSELEELKRLNTTKAQDLAAACEKITSLENHYSTSSSRIIELEQRDKTQSVELSSLREHLAAMSSLSEHGDHAVATLNEQIAMWKLADGCKAEEIIALHKELDELRRDLAASTNQIVEDQRHHATESADLTFKIEKWKRSDAAKAQELVNAHEQLAQLQQVNSTSSARVIELDQQNQTLLADLGSLHAQYEAASSYGEERDRIVATLSTEVEQWKLADDTKGQQLSVTRNELDQVRRTLSTSLSQIQEDQRLHAAETAELTSKLEEWKHSDVSRTQELSSAYDRIEQLEHDQAVSSSLMVELEQRNETQSMQLHSLHEQLKAMSSLSGDADLTVATLNGQIERWKLADSAKAEELIVARKELERLRYELVTVSSRADVMVEELTAAHESVDQLRRHLAVSSAQIVDDRERHMTRSAELTAEVEEWKRSDAAKAHHLAITHEQLERLGHELSASSSRINELQRHDQMLSEEFTSLSEQLRVMSSCGDDKDRTISNLTTQIEEWKQSDAAKTEQLNVTREDLDQLRLDLAANADDRLRDAAEAAQQLASAQERIKELEYNQSTSSSLIIEFEQRNETQSAQLSSLREQLEAMTSLSGDRDRTVAKLNTQIEKWKRADADKAERLIALRKELDQRRRDLSASVNQIAEDQHRHEAESTELASRVEEWKHSYATKTDELAVAHEQLEQLQRGLSTSSSLVSELQQRGEVLSTEVTSLHEELKVVSSSADHKDLTISHLTTEIEKWTQSDAIKAEELDVAHRDIHQLRLDQHHHAVESAKELASAHERTERLSAKLSSLRARLRAASSSVEERDCLIAAHIAEIEEWRVKDATRVEDLVTTRIDLEQLRRDVTMDQQRYTAESEKLTAQVEEWRRSDTAKAEKLSAAYQDLDQLRSDLAASATQIADVEQRHVTVSAEYAAKSAELATARETITQLEQNQTTSSSVLIELEQRNETQSMQLRSLHDQLRAISLLREDGDHSVTSLNEQIERWRLADSAKAEELIVARKELDRLHHELATVSSQANATAQELMATQKNLDQLYHDLATSSARIADDQQRYVKESAELTARVEKWQHSDALKSEELVVTREKLEQLEQVLSTSTSHLTEFQQRCESQSTELSSLHEQIWAASSYAEDRDRTIAAYIFEIEQWRVKDTAQIEELNITRNGLEQLRRDLEISSTQITQEQQHHATESMELTRRVEEWKRLDAAKADELGTAYRDLEQLRSTIAASSAQVIEDQQRQTAELATLASELEEWKRSSSTNAEELAIAREKISQLEHDQSTADTLIIELEQRGETQSMQLSSLQKQLEALTSLGGDRDRVVAALNVQIDQWKLSDASKAEELIMVRREVDKLQGDLAASAKQIVEDHKRHATELAEFTSRGEEWERSAAGRAEELAAASNELERLRHDLTVSSTQIVEDRERYTTERARLTSQIEQWKLSDAAKAEELAITQEKFEQFQRDLSASSSHHLELQQRCEVQLTELDSLRQQLHATSALGEDKDRVIATLNDQLQEWNGADSARLEKLRHARAELEEIWRRLLASPTMKEPTPDGLTNGMENAAIVDLTNIVGSWIRVDKKRVQDLAVELANRDKEIASLQNHLVTLKNEHEEYSRALRSALAERQSQLDGVQRFVTSADNYADTVIIQALQKLNAEVQNSTTIMVDCMLEDFQPHANVTEELVSAKERVSELIGQALGSCLSQESADELALYLQIAFQAYLSNHLSWIISSWTIEKEPNNLINDIYDRMQISETQTVSGRWRSLTRAYIAHNPTSDAAILTADAVEGLSDILLSAGCATSVSDAKSKLSSKFNGKVSGIISLAGQFGRMIGDVVSSDFAVLAARPLQVFKEETMEEDVDDDDKGQEIRSGTTAGEKVVCSTHLGLTKRMQLESGKKDTLTVVRTKVILESFLEGC